MFPPIDAAGMGEVYRAKDQVIGCDAAIKNLRDCAKQKRGWFMDVSRFFLVRSRWLQGTRGGFTRARFGQVLIWSSRLSLYSNESARAIQLASMIFSLTPTVPQTWRGSWLSMVTRTFAAVPLPELMTRTL